MYCQKCGTRLDDGAKYCSKCGCNTSATGGGQRTTLVPAKCTNCGASLDVDANLQAAVCPYCNQAYIVDQAINNYNVSQLNIVGNINIESATINVRGEDTGNLITRAAQLFREGKYALALKYYNRVLEMDFDNRDARQGIEQLRKIVIAKVEVQEGLFLLDKGILEITPLCVRHISHKGVIKEFSYPEIRNLRSTIFGYGLTFFVPGQGSMVFHHYNDSTDWIAIINEIKRQFPDKEGKNI